MVLFWAAFASSSPPLRPPRLLILVAWASAFGCNRLPVCSGLLRGRDRMAPAVRTWGDVLNPKAVASNDWLPRLRRWWMQKQQSLCQRSRPISCRDWKYYCGLYCGLARVLLQEAYRLMEGDFRVPTIPPVRRSALPRLSPNAWGPVFRSATRFLACHCGDRSKQVVFFSPCFLRRISPTYVPRSAESFCCCRCAFLGWREMGLFDSRIPVRQRPLTYCQGNHRMIAGEVPNTFKTWTMQMFAEVGRSLGRRPTGSQQLAQWDFSMAAYHPSLEVASSNFVELRLSSLAACTCAWGRRWNTSAEHCRTWIFLNRNLQQNYCMFLIRTTVNEN